MEKAKAGEAICWSHLNDSLSFIGQTEDGGIAAMTTKGLITTPWPHSLRMKPLFWKDSKPVYKGDKLWHKIAKKFIAVDCLQDKIGAAECGFFVDTDGIIAMAELCLWEEPKPKPPPKTTQVRYVNVYNNNGTLTLGATHVTKELAEMNAFCGSLGVARVEWQE